MAEKSDTTETIEVVEKAAPGPKKTVKKAEPKPAPKSTPTASSDESSASGFSSDRAYKNYIRKFK